MNFHRPDAQLKIFFIMLVYWLFFIPFICSFKNAAIKHHSVKNASKELDEFLFAFEDQLSVLANETAVLMTLYNRSITRSNTSYKYQSEKTYSLDKRGENVIDDGVRQHLYKVYRHLLMMIGTAGAAAAAAFSFGLTSAVLFPSVLSSIVIILLYAGTFFGSIVSSHKNLFSLSFAALNGFLMAPFLAFSAFPIALGGTALIFLVFTLAALLSPSDLFLKLGGPLLSVLAVTFFVGLFNLLFPSLFGGAHLVPLIWTYLISFSLFVGYDTQLMIKKAKSGITDHVADSMQLFLDLSNILKELVLLIGRHERDKYFS
jgi:hypothetical protein